MAEQAREFLLATPNTTLPQYARLPNIAQSPCADNEEIDRKSLRLYKANLRFTHDRFSQFEVDVLFSLYSIRHLRQMPDHADERGLLLPFYLRVLVTRIDEAGYLHWTHPLSQGGGIFVGGVNTTPSMIRITDRGIAYVESLGLEEKDAG